jgi:hypothetical protein
MNQPILADVNSTNVALFGILLLIIFLSLLSYFFYGLWLNRKKRGLSPYSRLPLRRGSELPYYAAEKVLRFLFNMHQYDNRIFDLRRAAMCRETGRIFPEAITWHQTIEVSWDFLQKRYPGKYVSWGSLTSEQQEIVSSSHNSLEGFQTEFSSPHPQPRLIEGKYAMAKPGPLYVDIENNVLLGWKCVPDTELEVLIVQKPNTISDK